MSIQEFFSHELNTWNNSIDFYLEDLAILQERLAEVTNKNTKTAVLVQAEHFQNQFAIQKAKLEEVRTNIKSQKEDLAASLKQAAAIYDLDIVDAQYFLRESIQLEEKIFMEMKHSFYRFLARVF